MLSSIRNISISRIYIQGINAACSFIDGYVVLDRGNMAYRDENDILNQIYEKLYVKCSFRPYPSHERKILFCHTSGTDIS